MTGYAYLENVLPEVYRLEKESIEVLQKPLLSAQQRLALMNLVKADNPDAKKQVIAHNLRLVVNIAKRYSNHGMALLDLVREGTLGLIHALENFELEGGFRFATYAAQCVRQRIERAIINHNNRLSIAAFQITPTLV
jgi:RNA polymerase nonessential primary-like sigma factor